MVEKDDKRKVLVFPEAEPPSVVIPVTAELMTTDVMSQAIDRCASSVRKKVSANQDSDGEDRDGDDNGNNVVIQVNFGKEER